MTGDLLRIWRYDRQRAIECSALNFIQDLPRFLVLLLTMQRFENRHWGLNEAIDSHFGDLPETVSNSSASTTMHIDDLDKGLVDVSLDLSSDKRVTHYGLNGRATNVYPATSQKLGSEKKLVAKFYWGEISRTSEAAILRKVNDIAQNEVDVRGHVPEMWFSHVFSSSSTALIRERLGLPEEGARVLYLIVFGELKRITELVGEAFLKCWWDTVMCTRLFVLGLNFISLPLKVISRCGGTVFVIATSVHPI